MVLACGAGLGWYYRIGPWATPLSGVTRSAEPPIDRAGIDFADTAKERGLDYVWPQQPRPMRSPEAFGCGCAFLDYDDDGWLDVLLVADPYCRLYHNTGQGRFEDATESSGLLSVLADATDGGWIGVAAGDYDGDGRLDILLTGFHRLALLRNLDGHTFQDVTTQARLDPENHGHWGASAGLMDLDGDNYLDLVIVNYVEFGPESKQYCQIAPGVKSGCRPQEYKPELGEIWHNDEKGGFDLVPHEQGMQSTHGIGLILAYIDLDDDGRLDFYIGNDGTPAEMMHNLGGMEFENIGSKAGVAVGRQYTAMAAMGVDFGDFNRDGLLDMTVTDFQNNCFGVFRNDGGVFLEVGNLTGISLATCDRLGFGAKWIDMDNDSWPDIAYANGHVYDNVGRAHKGVELRQAPQLFRNLNGKRFVDLVPLLGADVGRKIVGRGSATGDFNNDGRQDLLIVDYEGPALLLENRSQTNNHWLRLDLRSELPNALAYGAKVTARAGEQVWVGQVSPSSSYLSSSDPCIHWGLGKTDRLDTLTVRWPSGTEETLRDVPVDRKLRIVQGQGMVPAEPVH